MAVPITLSQCLNLRNILRQIKRNGEKPILKQRYHSTCGFNLKSGLREHRLASQERVCD